MKKLLLITSCPFAIAAFVGGASAQMMNDKKMMNDKSSMMWDKSDLVVETYVEQPPARAASNFYISGHAGYMFKKPAITGTDMTRSLFSTTSVAAPTTTAAGGALAGADTNFSFDRGHGFAGGLAIGYALDLFGGASVVPRIEIEGVFFSSKLRDTQTSTTQGPALYTATGNLTNRGAVAATASAANGTITATNTGAAGSVYIGAAAPGTAANPADTMSTIGIAAAAARGATVTGDMLGGTTTAGQGFTTALSSAAGRQTLIEDPAASEKYFGGYLNLLMDINTGSKITPYFGGGVGYGVYKIGSGENEVSEKGVGFQGLAGVKYKFSDNIALTLGYRFISALSQRDISYTYTAPYKAGTGLDSTQVTVDSDNTTGTLKGAGQNLGNTGTPNTSPSNPNAGTLTVGAMVTPVAMGSVAGTGQARVTGLNAVAPTGTLGSMAAGSTSEVTATLDRVNRHIVEAGFVFNF